MDDRVVGLADVVHHLGQLANVRANEAAVHPYGKDLGASSARFLFRLDDNGVVPSGELREVRLNLGHGLLLRHLSGGRLVPVDLRRRENAAAFEHLGQTAL